MTPPFKILGIDHIRFIVGNARQAMYYYQKQFGFRPIAYQGLETGNREQASYVLRQQDIVFVLSSPYTANSPLNIHLMLHGDGVRDVAFTVDDAEAAWKFTTGNGARSFREPHEIRDESGAVVMATIHTYGDTLHTFVQREGYHGPHLPGFTRYQAPTGTQSTGLKYIDHFVGNQPEGQMRKIAEWYERVLGFHQFWSVDDKDVATEYTALRSIVVADPTEVVKMPINRPAQGLKKSQIEEFVEFYSGPGIQHIAMYSDDIVKSVTELSRRGVEFLEIPEAYYAALPDRVGKIDEDIRALADLGILVDRDEFGYLLQIFTKPAQDRPTLFYEVIQRKGCQSFGKGNFRALFESIEREQEKRGNL